MMVFGAISHTLIIPTFEMLFVPHCLTKCKAGAYSARTAHPFQRNGAPFRFKLSKAQQVD